MTHARRAALVIVLCVSLLLPLYAQQPTARAVPDWVRTAVIYEIYPRTFSATGDLRGVEARLDDLKKLGVTILWLMPIHPVGQAQKKGTIGSPYAVKDYYAIDPAYGTKEDLKRLVGAAHRRGLRVVIDIVANHTAWDSVLMESPEFYKHDAAGNITPPVADWSDVAGLDYANPRLRAYMLDMMKYWLR
ncbi:MAG: alpha-amylase, partial [Acidobacteria bacterium]|nr:alpha-amylase [Acidobacteriota bacterium]